MLNKEKGVSRAVSITVAIIIAIAVIGGGVYFATRGEEKHLPAGKLGVTGITVSKTKPGISTDVEVTIGNPTKSELSDNFTLEVQGEEVGKKEVTVSPEDETTITFSVSKEKPGSYDLEVNGTEETLTVKKWYIGFLPYAIGFNEWGDATIKAGRWYAEDHNIKLEALPYEFDPAKEVTRMRTLVDKGVDALVYDSLYGKAVEEGEEYAHDHGVPCFTYNAHTNTKYPKIYVGFSNFEGGKKSARGIIKNLKEIHGKVPEGAVALTYKPKVPQSVKRFNGAKSVFENYPQLRIITVNGRVPATVTKRLRPVISENPDLVATWEWNDSSMRGAYSALKAEGMPPRGEPGHIVNAGMDADPISIEHIKEGMIDVVTDQPCTQYVPITLHFAVNYLEEGEKALPNVGETFEAGDLGISMETRGDVNLFEIAVWAPATVKTAPEDVPYFRTNCINVDNSNCDAPYLWGNMIEKAWL